MTTNTPSTRPDRAPRWSRWFVPLHLRLYRATGGRIGHRLGPQRTLLLTSTGRRSGQPRTQPITYFTLARLGFPADDRLLLVASNWGNDHPPAWYLNLLAHPRAHVQRGADAFDVIAQPVSAAERARLWPALVARNQQYGQYQASAAREIPVVALRPAARAPQRSDQPTDRRP